MFKHVFPTVAGVACLSLLAMMPLHGQASTGKPALPTPIRPVASSSPFTFQQRLPDIPSNLERRYVAVDTGGSATCAIRAKDRGIDCWGLNELGQASPPLKGKFKSLSLGGSVGCALTIGNRLACWGQETSLPGPDQVRRRYVAVSAGEGHVCVIRAGNRAVECWGSNTHGQLNSPRGAFRSISSRANKTCGVRQNGLLACWGDPAFLAYPRPTGTFRDVSVGTLHGCAVRADDSKVVCWGNGYYGEDLPPAGRFRSVTSGTDHTCGLRTDGTTACWGRNQWGQLDIPGDLPVRTLMAGGAQTCALDRDRRLLCRGSFAFNTLLFPRHPMAQSGGGEPQASPQVAIIDDLASSVITNFLGNLFTNWGDATDGALGDTLLFVGGLLGGSSDKATIEKLQAIQSQLDALANSLSAVDKKASVILSDIKILQCDDKLGDLDGAVRSIRAASLKYHGSGILTDTGSYMAQVRNELTKAQQAGYVPTDLRPSMRQFVADWYDKVAGDMARIDEVLMNAGYKTGPLGACLDKAFMAFQTRAGDKQFDDRRVYQGIYWVIQKAMVDQALGAQMLLDMNKFGAITALSDPAVEPDTPVIPEGGEWQAQTLCADVKGHAAKAASNRRWDRALQACQRNENVTRLLYRNLVQQIELAGAPYTDKDVMLSMGSDLLGKGTAKDNLLWLRSFERKLPGVRARHWNWAMDQSNNDLTGHGGANIYFSEGDRDQVGTWRADGRSWSDLFQNAEASGFEKDRVTFMANTVSDIDGSSLFNPEIKGITFWMTGSTYRLDWRDVIPDNAEANSAPMDGAKCFVGSEIMKICSSQELGGISGLSYDSRGFGTKYYNLRWNDKYRSYTQALGDYTVPYYTYNFNTSRPMHPDPDKITQEANFWPQRDTLLYRMPVLNVKYRNCTSAMVIANQDKQRVSVRLVAGNDGVTRELPSRCGTDLDYFIDKMIKRPDVPELDRLVRKPVYPAGVN